MNHGIAEPENSSLKRKDILLIGLAILSLVISCALISFKKYYWNDELYSWYFVSDPSFLSMWEAFNDKINNTPIVYFALGWIWARFFGASELSLRLFSSLGFCIGLVATWVTLRKTYSFWPVALGTLTIFCTSELVLIQNAEARMYGLFLALGAIALWQYDYLNRADRLTLKNLFWLWLIHVLIIHTHLFGPFYSGVILVAFVTRDIWFKPLRPKIYAAIVLSWVSWIFYLPAFRVQADAGHPRSWLPIPSLTDLISVVSLSSVSFVNVFFVGLLSILLVACLLLRKRSSQTQECRTEKRLIPSEISLLILAGYFLAMPLFIWLVSITARPIFWERYMIPNLLGYNILITFIFAKADNFSDREQKTTKSSLIDGDWLSSDKLLAFLFTIFIAAVLLHPLSYAKEYRGRSIPGRFDNTYNHQNLPMVVQASAQFLERMYYSPQKSRYYFVIDEAAAAKPESGLFGLQEYKHLDAFKRNYPEQLGEHILKSDEFLQKFDEFLVLDYLPHDQACPITVKGLDHARSWQDMHCPQWVETRLLNNPTYQVTSLGEIYGEEILLVRRKAMKFTM
jgi:hypothetical protein